MIKSKLLFLFIAVIILFGCGKAVETNRTYFLEGENRAIIIPVLIGDSLEANIMFDTGACFDCLELTFDFCTDNPNELWDREPDYEYTGNPTGWKTSDQIVYQWHNAPVEFSIGDRVFTYSGFHIADKNYELSQLDLHGVMGFPTNAEGIWELNFEHDYLEIHDAGRFAEPENCYWLRWITDHSYDVYVEFPITVTCGDGTTITMKYPYLIDTGLLDDIVLLKNAEEIEFFEQKEDYTPLLHPANTLRKRHIVKAEMFGGFVIDSMRIYIDLESDVLSRIDDAVIGLNFLRHFNVFFDSGNNRIGFQPISNYKRITSSDYRRSYYTFHFTEERTQIIDNLFDIKSNPFREAGFREGDEIVAVNGITLADMTFEEVATLRLSTRKTIDFIRGGEPLRLTVNFSAEEVAGE